MMQVNYDESEKQMMLIEIHVDEMIFLVVEQ
jgi:hypothetical protein